MKLMKHLVDHTPANRSYNDMHHQRNPWVWDYDSVFVHKGIAYAQFTNTHQACLVFNDAQLDLYILNRHK